MTSDIAIVYGKDVGSMTQSLLAHFSLDALIGSRSSRIVLKPNLVAPSLPEEGATTHVEIVTTIISYLKEKGFSDITMAEGAWAGASTEDVLRLNGYRKLEKSLGFKIVDTKRDKYRIVRKEGIPLEISQTILEADFLINLPVLKGHCQTGMTCAMKNLKGCLSDRSKRQFHQLGLMKPIAALNTVIKPGFTLVDSICGDLDFEEGGNPVETDRLFAGTDNVLLDIYGAFLLGFRPEEIGYLEEIKRMGRNPDLSKAVITELNSPSAASSSKPTGEARRLSRYTDADDACSVCFASLIRALKRLDEERLLGKLKGPVAIGQGWKGKSMDTGVGNCCRLAKNGVKGCPPTAEAMTEALRRMIK